MNQVNKLGMSPLMHALEYNESQNLNLNEEQFDYLIRNSDLKKMDGFFRTPLSYLLFYLEYKMIFKTSFNKETLKYFIENSDLSLIESERQLIELKKIQSEIANEELLSKVNNNKEIRKINKI